MCCNIPIHLFDMGIQLALVWTPKKPDIVMIEKKRPGGRGKAIIRII